MRSAIRKIVAIHGGNHYVAELRAGRHARYIRGLVRIQRKLALVRRAFRYRAESAATRAQIPENHESGRTPAPAFVHVWASGGFAHRVQIQPPEFSLELVNGWKMRGSVTQPFREARLRRRSRNQIFKRDERV
jgi:hypothetical protein